jgi:hypothetical protein
MDRLSCTLQSTLVISAGQSDRSVGKSEKWRFPADIANNAEFQMDATPKSTDHDGQLTSRPRLKRRGSLIARMNLQRESEIEKLVFWQSCWHVVAFFASYSILF